MEQIFQLKKGVMGQLGIGLIGTGFMAKNHALAWRNVKAVMGGDVAPYLTLLCDTPPHRAQGLACARAGVRKGRRIHL